MSQRPIGRMDLRDQAVPLVILALISVIPGVGFAAVFIGWSFLWVPALGAACGAGAVAFAIHRRLLVGESLALAILLLLVVGMVVVGGFTPAGATAFARGLITGWTELLTSFTPVPPDPGLLALPFVLCWFAALVGGELLRGTRVPALPAIGPLIAFATSLLFTVEDRTLALAQGVVIVFGTLALALAQQRGYRTVEDDLTTGSTERWNLRGLTSAALVIAVVVVAAPAAGGQLLDDDAERFSLRDHLVPPFDPLRIPSPLTGIKGQLRGDQADEPVFEVASPDRIDRWPIAVLGAYDGVVWTVAESTSEDAGRYTQIDQVYPGPPEGDLDMTRAETVAEVTVLGLRGHWVPRPGWVTGAVFPDGEDVRFNEVTGNVALPRRLRGDLTYEIRAIPVPVVAPEQRPEVPAGGVDTATLPPAIRNLIADLVQGEDAGWDQIRTIVDRFTQEGFYDISEATRPGHSLFRLGEFLADRNRIVGFEEQYAGAAAIAIRSLERPARVVVGYHIPEGRWDGGDRAEVVAGDMAAWIEVRTTDGWLALDVTPDRSREPDAEERGSSVEDVAIPNPPPPPPPPPDLEELEQDELEAAEAAELDDEQAAGAGGIPTAVLLAAAGAGSPLLLLLLLALAVGALRGRRRNRRRYAADPALRVAGAWHELLDRHRDFGFGRPSSSTTREAATLLGQQGVGDPSTLVAVAERVDRAAFHPAPPTDADAEAVWTLADELTADLVTTRTWWARTRDRFDLRTVLRRDPLRGTDR